MLGKVVIGTAAVLGAASFGTIGGIRDACHKYPSGTKVVSETTDDPGTKFFNVQCPVILQENGDVIGGSGPNRSKKGHIFPNGTAIDNHGQFIGEAKDDGSIYLTLPGVNHLDEFINTRNTSTEGSNLGVRAWGRVDQENNVWKYSDIYTGGGKGRSSHYDHSEYKHVASLDQKSDKTTEKEKNALGLFYLG